MTNVGGSRRAARALEILAGAEPLNAQVLDEAGIEHWRERLADAADKDWRERGVEHGRNYDLAVQAIRAELGRVPLTVESTVDPPRFPNRQERIYDPDADDRF